ncbi:MAG: tetratricopeptide repeat protein [Phycisphaerales bacterium]
MPRPATPAAITQLHSAGLAPTSVLRNAWQLPALLGALVLLISGVVTAVITAPRPDAARVFAQAEALLETGDFPSVLEVLNSGLRPYYERDLLLPEQQRRFHILRARTVYLGERKAGIELEENARAVNDEYAAALRLDPGPLESRDLFAWADVNITLARLDRALELASQLPPAERAGRGRLLKRIVERQLAGPRPDGEQVLRHIAEFLRDPQVTPADRAWALGRQAEFLMKEGRGGDAIAKILQTLPSLITEAPPDELGELYLLLGEAYAETGAFSEAGKRLEQALQLLLPGDPRRARALIQSARVDEQVHPAPAEGRAEAKQKYTTVIEQFAASEARLPALLGLGEVEGALGDAGASLRAYDELVTELGAGKRHPGVTIALATASLLDRARARLSAGETGLAIRYGALGQRLHAPDRTPPDLLLLLAQAHRKAAEEALAAGGPGAPAARRLVELSRVDPATREQARVHLIAAGDHYKRHADAVGIENNAGFGESLWHAADCFDLAGDSDRAIPLFADFARYFPGEPRQAEARYRLGQAQQSRGDYGTAADIYRALIEDSARQAASAGPFADACYVPLAQCLLMNAEAEDDAEAERLLEHVIQGGAGATSTPQFLGALVELGGQKVRRADYAGAIHHLEEAVARSEGGPQAESLRYSLADAYRLDARAIRGTLTHGMPDRQRQLLEETRLDRLRRAQSGFEEVRRALEARDARTLSALESLQLRNAAFYLGDCAFDLRDFEAAIHHYDGAREKYPSDPASLVAMVQIVNAYIEQGDLKRAETANERAIRFYKSLPPSVWADPDLPMTKDEWGAWLDSIARLMKDRASPASAGVSDP